MAPGATLTIFLLPLTAGYAGHWLGGQLVIACHTAFVAKLVPVLSAPTAAYAVLRAIRALLFWIASQDLPDGDMPLAHPDRILGRARFLPALVFAAALAHALLSVR